MVPMYAMEIRCAENQIYYLVSSKTKRYEICPA